MMHNLQQAGVVEHDQGEALISHRVYIALRAAKQTERESKDDANIRQYTILKMTALRNRRIC